jgi:hypothetical protein
MVDTERCQRPVVARVSYAAWRGSDRPVSESIPDPDPLFVAAWDMHLGALRTMAASGGLTWRISINRHPLAALGCP